MTEKTGSDKSNQRQKFDEDEEQATAKDEPMGSVAAAVPRDAGSAVSHNEGLKPGCDAPAAPAHKGGHGTLVAGTEAHQAEESGKKQNKH